MKTETKEVNAIVLDVLMKGNLEDQRSGFRREPVVQAIGIEQFKLLELVPKTTEIRSTKRSISATPNARRSSGSSAGSSTRT